MSALQDPVWTPAADLCVGCGYSLRGLSAPGRCPECGAAFGTGQLVLTGIVHRSRRASASRRAAWAAVITSAVLLSIFWMFLLMFHALLLVAAVLAMLGGAVALWITGPRERTGVERLVVTPSGIARVALRAKSEQAGLDTLFTPFDGANTAELTRVSPVWRRLRLSVVSAAGGAEGKSGAGPSRRVFDAGFRCPDSHAPEVERVVREFVQTALAAHEGDGGVPAPPAPSDA